MNIDVKLLQDNIKEITDFTLTLLHSDKPILDTIKNYPNGEALTKLAVQLESILIEVVEGIETEEEYNALKESGIPQLYQGYYFAKPMPAKDILTIYKANEMKQ